jgi:hypothetical protein
MNGNERAIERAQSCAEPVASDDQKEEGLSLLAKLIVLVLACAVVPVALHLLVNLSIWSWELVK